MVFSAILESIILQENKISLWEKLELLNHFYQLIHRLWRLRLRRHLPQDK